MLYEPSFNSLSRDHKTLKVIDGWYWIFDQLSTPSLGITVEGDMGFVRNEAPYSTFNSLSRDHLARGVDTIAHKTAIGDFQLPLSGSRRESRSSRSSWQRRSFNSLSRDHGITANRLSRAIHQASSSFNSLSRDHAKFLHSLHVRLNLFAFNSLSRDH